MKRLILTNTVLLLLSIFIGACTGDVIAGDSNSQTIPLTISAFDRIVASGAFRLEIQIQEGSSCTATLTADESRIKTTVVKVENGVLHISSKGGHTSIINSPTPTLKIVAPSLKSIGLSGANHAHVKGNLKGDMFSTTLSGASKMELEQLEVNELNTEISGAGMISIMGGISNQARFSLSGASVVRAGDYKCKETEIAASGSSKAEVFVSEKLSVEGSGASKVRYHGNPVVTKDVSGVSNVSHIE